MEVGNSSILAEKEESKIEEPRIALDSIKIDEILDLCIKDLKYPRTINGKNIILVTDYNDKTKIITFGEKIETLQKLLKIKETSIGEFFSWYFVNNFRKYISTPEIELNDLNFFVGTNSSGKSTVVKSYLLIYNFLKSGKLFEIDFSEALYKDLNIH